MKKSELKDIIKECIKETMTMGPGDVPQVHAVKSMRVGNLELFTPSEVSVLTRSDFDLHSPDDEYWSQSANDLFSKNMDTSVETGEDFDAFLVAGYKKTKGSYEYYIIKKKNLYYTFVGTLFQESGWFLGGNTEIISPIHKFNKIESAVSFIKAQKEYIHD